MSKLKSVPVVLEIDRNEVRKVLEALEYASTGNRRPEIIGPAIEALRSALSQQGEQQPNTFKDAVYVAITMLFDSHANDVLRVFSTRELTLIADHTEALGSIQVEDIYREAFDALDAAPAAQPYHIADANKMVAAQPLTDEQIRPEFEAMYRKLYPVSCDIRPNKFERDGEGDYAETVVNVAWNVWKAAHGIGADK